MTRKFPPIPWILAATLAVCAAYANSFHNSFHFDDFHTIVDNPAIRSLHNIPRFFTDATTFSVLPPNRTYRPTVSTSLALDYAVTHSYNVLWFHVSTFIIFLLLLATLFFFIRATLLRVASLEASNTVALLSAAWFGLHPAIAETVNYIIQRGDIYCTFGCVGALALWANFPKARRTGLYLLPLVFALLSKPPAVIFPALLFLYVYFFDSNGDDSQPTRWRRASLAIFPSLIITIALLILQSHETPKSFYPSEISPWQYRLTQPYVLLRYFTALFLPLHLNVDTDLQPFTTFNQRAFSGLFFLACLAAVIWLTSQHRRLYPIAFGLAWFVIAELPTSLYTLSELENDHRMFFAFAGLIPAACWSLWLVTRAATHSIYWPKLRIAFATSVFLALCGYAWGTHLRNKAWLDEASLWHDDVLKSPHNGRGLMIYGVSLMNTGDYANALTYFNRALEFTPNYDTLEINLGIVNGALGRDIEAERHFQRAIALQPNDDEAHAYYARWLLQCNRDDEALAQLNTAIALNPERPLQRALRTELLAPSPAQNAAWWIDHSLAQYREGSFADSLTSAQHALALDPNSATGHNNAGAALGALRQWNQAIAEEETALRLQPDLQVASNNLALFEQHRRGANDPDATGKMTALWINRSLSLNQSGQFEASIRAAHQALKLDPHSAEAWNNIAADNESLQRWDEAITAAQKALTLRPDFQLARNNLAWSVQQKKINASAAKP